MWVAKREYELLKNEIEFWRKKYDEEHERANSITATLLQTNGLPAPQPRDTIEAGDDHMPASLKKLQMMIPELLAETIEDSMDADVSESVEAN